jgi:retron-type reverse transcriptase
VLDRLIQQAVAQVLTPIFDAQFSASSFGFRQGRSAHQAVEAARGYVADGYRWVVDDKPLLRLIRAYIEAGGMVDGVKQPTAEGTPQGSPLSPLLSNIMLDDLDVLLEQRGHRFVRYADDVRVFVRSERAARRVLDGVTAFVEDRLALKVNQEKSAITPASTAGLLGFAFYFLTGGKVGIRVHAKARKRGTRRSPLTRTGSRSPRGTSGSRRAPSSRAPASSTSLSVRPGSVRQTGGDDAGDP